MQQKKQSAPIGQNALDTLAQSGSNSVVKPAVIIQGQGSEIGDEKTMKGRAKRKTIAQIVSLALVDIAKRKGDEELQKAFWNTYHCQSRLVSTDNRTFGLYCKNRHCPLCCSIRKATLIRKYLPDIQQWEAPHFVTLTVKSCSAKKVAKMLQAMIRGIRIIITKYRKKAGLEKLCGIRALECCFNPVKRSYNPHFHIIVPNQQTAEILIAEWLKLWTPKFAGRQAQKVRAVGILEKDLIETIKYGAKIFTDPDMKKGNNRNHKIYAAALYNIYAGMKGTRLFERFGFDTPETEQEETPAQIITDYDEWQFHTACNDWLGIDNEQVLSNYQIPQELLELLKNNVDKVTE